MPFLIIEILIFIGFVYLFYQCCAKGYRNRPSSYDNHQDGVRDNHEDLRQFRERMSERGNDTNGYVIPNSQAGGNNSASAIAARKELIEKNLFSRVIHREESVKELSQLLAISRGGVVDEELGECNPAADPAAASSGGEGRSTTASESSSSSLPTPSVPPPRAATTTTTTVAASTTTDTIATALSSPPPETSAPNNNIPSKHPLTLVEPIRNLWSNLTGSERETAIAPPQAAAACQVNVCTTTPYPVQHKLECSICLDDYSPNDTIAWAKDGGDPPTSTTRLNTNNEVGCDHIFHKECLVSWLMQDHDECPLCRRKVVHTDVDVRFAGWDR